MNSIFFKSDHNYEIISDPETGAINLKSSDENALSSENFNQIKSVVDKAINTTSEDIDFHISIRHDLYNLNFVLDFINSSKIVFPN